MRSLRNHRPPRIFDAQWAVCVGLILMAWPAKIVADLIARWLA